MSLTDSNKKKNYSNVTNGNVKVAEIPSTKKTNLNVIRQIGNKAKDKFSVNKLLDSKQKPAKVINLNKKNNG